MQVPEIFGYDGKLVIIAGVSLLTWIFLVAGTATPWYTLSGSYGTLFENCLNIGNDKHQCEHTFGCTKLDSTVRGGAAFAVMSILLWCVVCAITIGRIFKPAFFDRPEMPKVVYGCYGVTAFMLLIAWACAFGAFHAKCDGSPHSTAETPGSKIGACGWLLLFAQVFVFVQAGIEFKLPAGKTASDNYNAVGSQPPQHVAVSADTSTGADNSNQYGNSSTGGNATGYADVSEQ